MNKAQRLREYGMYIRKTGQGTFNLGWTQSQRPGGIGNFPTWDDAYDTFEEVVNLYWEYDKGDFQQWFESILWNRQHGSQPTTPETVVQEHEQHLTESRTKLYDLTKP